MKASELMIGDWVKTDDGTSKVVSLHDAWHIDVEDNDYTYDEYQVYPIPLTEEILEANGFEINDNVEGWQLPNDNVPFCIEEFSGLFIFNGVYNDILVEYVHQLQHALRLCGLSELADNLIIE